MRRAVFLPLLLAALVGACSDDGGGASPRARAGPLARWSGSSVPTDGAVHAATVEALAPCRVRFLIQTGDAEAEAVDERVLPTAGVLRAEWSALVAAPPATATPPEADVAAGRTEGRRFGVMVGWSDGSRLTRAATLWAKPGAVADLSRLERPPPVPEDLDAGARVELVTAAGVDGVPQARLVPSPKGAHVAGAPGASGPVRALHVRAWLEVLPR